jgi:hypothetical protein
MQWYAQRFAVRPGDAVAQCPQRCCFHAGINAKDCVVTWRVFTLRFHILCFHIAEAVNGEPVVNASQAYASFSDPDGNGWLLQEITVRLSADIEVGDTRFTDEVVKATHATAMG